jgi:hypothetical protein
MRMLACLIAMAAVTACTTTGRDADIAEVRRLNAASATADAQKVIDGADEDPASQCVVFLGISRHHRSTRFDLTEAGMARAQALWKAHLRKTMSEQEMDQLTGSSVNMLEPADPATRDAASRWCVQNAPGANMGR